MMSTARHPLHDNSSRRLSRSSDCVDSHAPDALSEILADVRLSGASYCRTELSSPWGIDFTAQNRAQFHLVAEGTCWLRMTADDPVPRKLTSGDLVLFPRGARHLLSSRASGRAVPLEDLPREQVSATTNRLRAGGGGAQTALLCCSFGLDAPAARHLFDLMPPALIVPGAATQDSVVPTLLDMMADEVAAPRPGTATMMARLADLIVTRSIRSWSMAPAADTSGWLAAIRDPRIGKALAAMHRDPAGAWSVDALAEHAALSRSMFSERFTSLLGTGPAQYLTRWRMQLASDWLRREQMTVAEAAARAGYESEASFSRAFKRIIGVSPGSLRSTLAKSAARRA